MCDRVGDEEESEFGHFITDDTEPLPVAEPALTPDPEFAESGRRFRPDAGPASQWDAASGQVRPAEDQRQEALR